MKILGIDTGASCGWAAGDGSGPLASGTWNLAPRPGDSPGVRYILLRTHLEEILRAYPDLGLVVCERAHHRGGAATQYAYGYLAHVESWCAERTIEHAVVHSGTLKKHATGRGNAKKDEMRAAGAKRWADRLHRGTSHDEVDALWILDWARTVFGERAA